jgi:hypothetical protein
MYLRKVQTQEPNQKQDVPCCREFDELLQNWNEELTTGFSLANFFTFIESFLNFHQFVSPIQLLPYGENLPGRVPKEE